MTPERVSLALILFKFPKDNRREIPLRKFEARGLDEEESKEEGEKRNGLSMDITK